MRIISYEWRLREVMASRGIFSTTKLIPLLKERGVNLSSSQIYRLAAEKPERLNLHVLAALMDILDCTCDDLIQRVSLGEGTVSATGTDDGQQTDGSAAVLRERGIRPRRMKVSRPPDA
jgi:DNA-binding Xre family transcriptional regulator